MTCIRPSVLQSSLLFEPPLGFFGPQPSTRVLLLRVSVVSSTVSPQNPSFSSCSSSSLSRVNTFPGLKFFLFLTFKQFLQPFLVKSLEYLVTPDSHFLSIYICWESFKPILSLPSSVSVPLQRRINKWTFYPVRLPLIYDYIFNYMTLSYQFPRPKNSSTLHCFRSILHPTNRNLFPSLRENKLLPLSLFSIYVSVWCSEISFYNGLEERLPEKKEILCLPLEHDTYFSPIPYTP